MKFSDNNGKCPDGYEYVKPHYNKGSHVRSFCRKIKTMHIKMKIKMEYPGETEMDVKARYGLRHANIRESVPTDSILMPEIKKQLDEKIK